MPKAIDQDTYTIQKVPIFSVGTWHGKLYDRSALDRIVEAFPQVGFKPPVKLGHSENQKLLKRSGLPAAGYVQSVYREDDTLYADFSDVPKQINDLILKKAYDNVSVELYIDYEDARAAKKHPYVLRAVALLGDEIPEVTDLGSITSLYHDRDNRVYTIVSFDEVNVVELAEHIVQKKGSQWCLVSKSTGETIGCHDSEEKALAQERAIKARENMKQKEEEEMSEEIDKLKKSSEAELAKRDTEIQKMQKDNADLQARLKSQEEQNKGLGDRLKTHEESLKAEREIRRHEKIKTTVSEFVRKKKVTPAQKPFLEALFMALPQETEIVVKLSKDGKEEEQKMAPASALERFVDSAPTFIAAEVLGNSNVTDDIDQRVRVYCKENKLDYNGAGYAKALIEVTKMTKEVI